MNLRQGLIFILVAALIGAVIGYCAAWKICTPPQSAVEGYSAPISHSDGSLTLERKPDSLTAPATAIPAGDKATRYVKIKIHDTLRTVIHVRDTDVVCPPCAEIPLDLTVSSGKTGSHVTIKGPAGVVVSGVDFPLGKPVIPHPWRIGASVDPIDRRVGGVVLRDAGALFVGASGQYWPSHGFGVVLMAGIRF